MNIALLNPKIQDYITANCGKDIVKLALQKNPFPEANWIAILNQIASKTKAKEKLPTWFSSDGIVYPNKISVEQTSSEKTAAYKAELVSGAILLDATGGFGVDDYYFSKKVTTVIHCEIDPKLSQIVNHNFKALQVHNTTCIAGESAVTIEELNQKLDWIYIDPSRRNDQKGKVFLLKDCAPNVPELLDFYFKYTDKILIKTAPILDIAAGLLELKNVKTIHIVAVENEVKELLWEIENSFSGDITIKTVALTKEKNINFGFKLQQSNEASFLSLPKKYLFEPNNAIMKSGGFEAVSDLLQVGKLHQHSHLYTSDTLLDFPGRRFKIAIQFSYNKPNMKQYFENQQANVTTRNFSDTVETIRKKWKIKDGGIRYCFFTTDLNNNKIVLICTKI